MMMMVGGGGRSLRRVRRAVGLLVRVDLMVMMVHGGVRGRATAAAGPVAASRRGIVSRGSGRPCAVRSSCGERTKKKINKKRSKL